MERPRTLGPAKALSIRIKHCVERDFLDLFRADLAASTDCVELLSPFVSPNRSSDYYAVFTALSLRSVRVHAYVRPCVEQPESLRASYSDAIRDLELRGVRVQPRPGMHEKVATVDGRILWHGSLNILSHNNSRESMLRFESSELVQEILQDLGVQISGTTENGVVTGAEAEGELTLTGPKCAVCGGSMRLFESAGIWLCNDSPKCPGVRSVGSVEIETEAEALEAQLSSLDLNCPLCDSPMVVTGILRRQVSCPTTGCGFQLEPRLSTGILRILSRRRAG